MQFIAPPETGEKSSSGSYRENQAYTRTVPRALLAAGHDQKSVSMLDASSGSGPYAEGNLADLMMSSADLLWAVKAAESRLVKQGNCTIIQGLAYTNETMFHKLHQV